MALETGTREYVLTQSPLIRYSELESAFLAARGVFWTWVSIREELKIIRRERIGERPLTDTVKGWHWENIRRHREEERDSKNESLEH